MGCRFIPLFNGNAIICGLPKDHICDDKGDMVYTTESGKTITWNTFRKLACFTEKFREGEILKKQYEEGDPVISGSVTCSICGISKIDDYGKY